MSLSDKPEQLQRVTRSLVREIGLIVSRSVLTLKVELPEKLIIYHAGTGRTTFLAMVKITTLFIGAFFCFIVAPSYIKADKPEWETASGMSLTHSWSHINCYEILHVSRDTNTNQSSSAASSPSSLLPTQHPPLSLTSISISPHTPVPRAPSLSASSEPSRPLHLSPSLL